MSDDICTSLLSDPFPVFSQESYQSGWVYTRAPWLVTYSVTVYLVYSAFTAWSEQHEYTHCVSPGPLGSVENGVCT